MNKKKLFLKSVPKTFTFIYTSIGIPEENGWEPGIWSPWITVL
jgi:hypothetical protein